MPVNVCVLKTSGNPSGHRHKNVAMVRLLILNDRKTKAPDHTDKTGWTDKYQKSEI